jgi:PKD repeat protein
LSANGQTVQADFLLPSNACLNERLKLVNQSTGATNYEWDFCQGDLSRTPTASTIRNLNGNVTLGIDVVFDGTNWYGFVLSRNTNSILRLEFGASLYTTPTVTDLGNISNLISNPSDIKVVSENGNWYGFVYGSGIPAVVRVDFGNSLLNTTSSPAPISASVVINSSGSSNGGFDMFYDGSNWYILYIESPNINIVKLAAINTTPAIGDIIPNVSIGGSLTDVSLQKFNGNFYGYVVSQSQTLKKLSFGSNLFSTPIVSDISSFLPQSANPYGVDIVLDNGNYYLLISTLQGNLYRINLAGDLSSAPASGTDLGILSILVNTIKLRFIKQGTNSFLFTTDYISTNLFRIDFPNPTSCPANIPTSTATDPTISYNTPGTQYVTLKSYNGGSVQEISKAVLINSLTAPDIGFSSQNVCVNHDVNFIPVNASGGLTGFNWSFGDSQTSTSPNPTHQYVASGDYDLSLSVTADNGCNNYIENSISIFDEPVPDFQLPAVNPFCTNQNYLFDNTSTSDPGYPVTWQWSVNGTPQSTSEDFNFAFTQTSNQDVMLSASIPGCVNNITKSITTLVGGPLPDFSFSGQCEDVNVTFSNSSSGTIDGYSWDFDDGQNSTTTNPTHIFSTIGSYDVTLTTFNSVTGCNNTKTRTVPIYSVPQVNFLLSPPPFSCNGTPSQFNDLTPTPTDSNISTWSWNFGDAGSSQNTSTIKNPQHTYANPGPYNVSLLVSTNFLCSATIQLPVTISQTPIASFNNGATCEDVPVAFSDTSPGTIQSWNWTIGSSNYTTQNPMHTFINPGNTTATLSVTASNNCIGTTIPKPITVPAKLSPAFTVAKNCINQQTVFTDATNGTADPISAHSWSFGQQGTATGSPVTFTFSSTGNVNVTHTVTTQTGCVYPVSNLVNIIQSPTANFTASPLIGSQPLLVQFTNSSVNATTYLWNFHDANNSTSTQISPTFTYSSLGTYSAQLTAFNAQNCSHSSSSTIRVVNPMVDVALGGLELMELQNGSFKPAVTIFNNSNVPINNISLLIDLTGSVIRERVNYLIMPNTSYRYVFSFEFLLEDGTDYFCIEAEVDDPTPLDNRVCMNFEQPITLFPPYPNPTKGEMQVDWIMKEDGIVNLTLVNNMGQEVRNAQVNSIEGLNPFRLDSKGLVTGTYFLKIKFQHFTKVYRVFISE